MRNKIATWVSIAVIVFSGFIISAYLITRGSRANDICNAVNQVHDVLEELLLQSESLSVKSIEENPQPGVTVDQVRAVYQELIDQLDPIDVTC